MQILETPETQRPKRSMSYNDLKKKRLMRSSKSSKKIGNGEYYFSTVKKKPVSDIKSLVSGLPQDEKMIQNYILELKGVLGQIHKKSEKKRTFTIRQNLTERPSAKNSILVSQNKVQPIWSNIVQADSTKQLIKNLLSKNKNKSQRKFVKLSEIRDNFKKEKERSLSQDKQLLPPKKVIKEIPSPLKTQTKYKYTQKHSPEQHEIHIKNTKINIKLSEVIQLKDYLVEQNPTTIQLDKMQSNIPIYGKQNQQGPNNRSFVIDDVSSIINDEDYKKDNQTTQHILDVINSKQSSQVQGSFLKLMNGGELRQGWRGSREVKRRGEMQRIKRIFPVGFFDN